MSLYSSVSFGAQALPAAGLAAVTNSQMSVRVEEDQMLLVLNFQGNILGGGAGALTMGFLVDGVAATTLPLMGFTFIGATQLPVNFSLPVALSKGEHKIALTANDVGTAGHTINGAAFDSRFSATRLTNDATLGHGVGSKVQLQQ